MATKTKSADHYPKPVKLRDGREVTVRIMDPADKAKILDFARSLAEDDLLFLRTDITDAAVVDTWTDNVKKGNTVTLLAEAGNKIAGYASVHREQARWTRRVGEIRMIASAAYRGAGL
ncbi:MAG: GNAT family N-acetyltransferase, partial [Candidatus Binataceae bacterium]